MAEHVRPFADVLRDIRGGDLHEELSAELARVVAAVESTGLSGKLVLTLNVKAMKARGRVIVSDLVKPTLPEVRRRLGVLRQRRPPNTPRPQPARAVRPRTETRGRQRNHRGGCK